VVPPKSVCEQALNWDKLSFGEVVPAIDNRVPSHEPVPSHGPERTVAGIKFRTGGNRLRRAQSSRGNGGRDRRSLTSVASVTSCSKILVRAGPGAPGILPSLQKRIPTPPGTKFCPHRGSFRGAQSDRPQLPSPVPFFHPRPVLWERAGVRASPQLSRPVRVSSRPARSLVTNFVVIFLLENS
jgi:hypothetical protein